MSWSEPFSDDELAFIEASFPRLSAAEIARRLSRSPRGVNRKVNELGLRDSHARASDPPETPPEGGGKAPAESGAQDTLSRLRELREVLRAKLVDDIDPRAIKGVSEEYRAVLAQIRELEERDDGKREHGAAQLASIVRLRAS